MTDEKINEEFEKFLHEYCFQKPPKEAMSLMKDVFENAYKISERISKVEVLQEILNEYEHSDSKALLNVFHDKIDILSKGLK